MVDAGMRQLAATGWMHGRARMIAASFLIKDLHIDWLAGERWFMRRPSSIMGAGGSSPSRGTALSASGAADDCGTGCPPLGASRAAHRSGRRRPRCGHAARSSSDPEQRRRAARVHRLVYVVAARLADRAEGLDADGQLASHLGRTLSRSPWKVKAGPKRGVCAMGFSHRRVAPRGRTEGAGDSATGRGRSRIGPSCKGKMRLYGRRA